MYHIIISQIILLKQIVIILIYRPDKTSSIRINIDTYYSKIDLSEEFYGNICPKLTWIAIFWHNFLKLSFKTD